MTPCMRIASRVSLSPSLPLSVQPWLTLVQPLAVLRPTHGRLFHASLIAAQSAAAAATVSSADPGRPRSPTEPISRAPEQQQQRRPQTLTDRIALKFRDYIPNTTETYVAYDVTRTLYAECAAQAAYTDGEEFTPSAQFWYRTCARPPTFQAWSQVTMLHMWMIAARLRALDRSRVKVWQQHFIDHFFYDAEDAMLKRYAVKRAGERAGYVKDLYHQYRGMTAAFDEALVRGDAVLATALWRNVFNASDDVDVHALALVTSHVRRCLSRLGAVGDDVVLGGRVAFGLPLEEKAVVNQHSRFLGRHPS